MFFPACHFPSHSHKLFLGICMQSRGDRDYYRPNMRTANVEVISQTFTAHFHILAFGEYEPRLGGAVNGLFLMVGNTYF